MLNRVAAPRHWNLAVQLSCDWGASNIAAAKEAEAEQKRGDKTAKAKEARAQKEQKAKEKAEKAENKAKEKAEKTEKKAKGKAEKAQAAAAASLAAACGGWSKGTLAPCRSNKTGSTVVCLCVRWLGSLPPGVRVVPLTLSSSGTSASSRGGSNILFFRWGPASSCSTPEWGACFYFKGEQLCCCF